MTVVDMNHDNWKTDKPIFVPKTGAIEKNALFTRPAAKHPSIPRVTFWKSALKVYRVRCGNSGCTDRVVDTGIRLKEKRSAGSENKVLCHPASIDSIPTSANKEDHVSMGTISARKCRDIITNAEDVIAIELLCAAQALDLFTNKKPGEGTLAAYQAIRQAVPHLEKDRIVSADIIAVKALMRNAKILNTVEKQVGALQ